MLTKMRKRIKQLWFLLRGYKPWVPAQRYPDDIFLVSYPKSGSTWLRFMLASYVLGEKCDFRNVHDIIPDIHMNPNQCAHIARPRIIKSHMRYESTYENVIFLVRDGRDVAVSYYFHAQKYDGIDQSVPFAQYLEWFNKGIGIEYGSWGSHVLSWLNHAPERLLLVHYEDLKQQPHIELERVLTFIGLPVNTAQVTMAVEAAAFERMQSLEKDQRTFADGFKQSVSTIRFVRKGQVGGWADYFDEQQLSHFLDVHGQAMRRLGYLS